MEIRQRSYDAAPWQDSDLHPTLRRVYAARGLTPDCCELALGNLHPPASMLHMDTALDLLESQLHRQGKILVVGDFDADGATSSALCLLSLRAMGYRNVDYLVPNRFEYGYGLTPEIAAVACESSPDLLITVDNGISSHAGVAYCQAHGVKVLITDHHLPGETLPAADCILNPNLHGCQFPSKALAGVGVVFYLMLALRARLRDTGWFLTEGFAAPNLARYLDIVALGTVADVVALDRNNRILVQHGLRILRSGQGRPGIRALLAVAKRIPELLSASDLGFAAGPRLNAAGRLDDMSLGIECLLCEDPTRARQIAQQLDELNKARRQIEQDMQEAALACLDTLPHAVEDSPGLCLYDPGWHQGVIGILASRLKERYHRPVIVFADAGEGMIKGSARSIPGLHMRDLLEAVSTSHPGLVRGFGGHAMAAGLTLDAGRFAEFAGACMEQLEDSLDDAMLNRVLWTDGELQPVDFCLEFATALHEAGPWGQHFPEPLFEGTFCVRRQRVLAEKHLKLGLDLPDGSGTVDAIAFNAPGEWLQGDLQSVRLVYRLDRNAWAGDLTLQLMIEHLVPLE